MLAPNHLTHYFTSTQQQRDQANAIMPTNNSKSSSWFRSPLSCINSTATQDVQQSQTTEPLELIRKITSINTHHQQAEQRLMLRSMREPSPLPYRQLLSAVATQPPPPFSFLMHLKELFITPPTPFKINDHQEVCHTITQRLFDLENNIGNEDTTSTHRITRLKEIILEDIENLDTPFIDELLINHGIEVENAINRGIDAIFEQHEYEQAICIENVERTILHCQYRAFTHGVPWTDISQDIQAICDHFYVARVKDPKTPKGKAEQQAIRNAIRDLCTQRPPYQIYPNGCGHFKADKSGLDPRLPASQVRTESGEIYELLNTLNIAQSDAVLSQHGIHRIGATELGSGSYGRVRIARHCATGKIVAVKKFESKANAEQEIKIYQQLGAQPGLMVLNDVAHCWSDEATSIDRSYLFMPLTGEMNGKHYCLWVHQNESITPEQRQAYILNIAEQWVSSVNQLHRKDVSHLDIKPGNFLIRQDHAATTQAFLSDFGLSQQIKEKPIKIQTTRLYAPPEYETVRNKRQCKELKKYNRLKHDMYSLGASLFTLQYGFSPSLKHNGQVIFKPDFFDDQGQFKKLTCTHYKKVKTLDDLIGLLMQVNPKHRPNAKQACHAIKRLVTNHLDQSSNTSLFANRPATEHNDNQPPGVADYHCESERFSNFASCVS